MLEKRRRRTQTSQRRSELYCFLLSLDELTSVARLRRSAVEETRRESASVLPPYFLFISLIFTTCWLLFPVPFSFLYSLPSCLFVPSYRLSWTSSPSIHPFILLSVSRLSFLRLFLSNIWSISFVTSFFSSLNYLHSLILVLPYFLASLLLFNPPYFLCIVTFAFLWFLHFFFTSCFPFPSTFFYFIFLLLTLSVIQSLSFLSFIIFFLALFPLVLSCLLSLSLSSFFTSCHYFFLHPVPSCIQYFQLFTPLHHLSLFLLLPLVFFLTSFSLLQQPIIASLPFWPWIYCIPLFLLCPVFSCLPFYHLNYLPLSSLSLYLLHPFFQANSKHLFPLLRWHLETITSSFLFLSDWQLICITLIGVNSSHLAHCKA